MARMPELEQVAKEHNLRILSVADLIEYRLQTERLVQRVGASEITLDQTGTTWNVVTYESSIQRRQFLALVKGTIDAESPTLCRVHTGSTVADVFSSPPHAGGRVIRECLERIERAGSGVLVYLPHDGDVIREVASLSEARQRTVANESDPLREFGLGAQVLVDLGVRKICLLTNNPRKITALGAYGLTVEGTQSVDA
jgi:3,4-dihydroxy 2-butanone 4-phosphate synthase/GTP cyclohydrolase II